MFFIEICFDYLGAASGNFCNLTFSLQLHKIMFTQITTHIWQFFFC